MDIELSNAEMLIMEIIWATPKPVSAMEIQERLKEKEWKIQTINTLLKRLLTREIIGYEKVKTGKTYAYYYSSKINKEEYKGVKSQTFLESVHNGSLYSFISAFVQDNSVSTSDVERARKWLSEWEDDDEC